MRMAAPLQVLHLIVVLLVAAVQGVSARIVPVEYLYPPFNLTYFHFIDTNGVFLVSPNGTFSAAVYNAGSISSSDTQSRFFFSVLHTDSRTPVWTATAAGSTILESVVLSLSAQGLSLFDPSSSTAAPAWSTPGNLRRPVAALRLLDAGELRLIDGDNATLWTSYDRPTDTLLPVSGGQALRVGMALTSSTSEQDLTPGAYRLLLTPNDALLQWKVSADQSWVTYWAMSSDPGSVQDSSYAVASMAVNDSGIYLLAADGRDATVYRLLFPSPSKQDTTTRVVKVDPSGRLIAVALSRGESRAPTVWSAPGNDCELPVPCGSLGICTPGGNGSTCGCPDAFSTYASGGCAPADGSALPTHPHTCQNHVQDNKNKKKKEMMMSYVSLGAGIGYLPNKLALPEKEMTSSSSISDCRDLCSANCSCLGFFYRNSSRSCFLLHNQIGSVFRRDGGVDREDGFIKTFPAHGNKTSSDHSKLSFITIVFGIVLPSVAAVFVAFLLYAIGTQWLNKKKHHLEKKKKNSKNQADEDEDSRLIPGLPTRFSYQEMETATDGFKWQIGSGGFGSVFRGELPDRTTVAVKKMNGLQGTQQGRRQFLTEIAVIGNVHHVNLVKLRGFCADGGQNRQLLVYEYMNRGSLDQTLFFRPHHTQHQLLEWPARLRVCIGAARGLAYLHAGCDRKILHCDVKPENILLDDRGGVKIADFGLAKLMSPEQSGFFTTMRGTRGYLAPEWLMNAPITEKADVYSFGMVLLEIVRGRKNSNKDHLQHQEDNNDFDKNSKNDDTSSSSDHHQSSAENNKHTRSSCYFPALALDLHERARYEDLVDPRLEGRADVHEVARVVRVALCCLHEDAAHRPNMTAVSAMLDGTMDVAEPRTELLRYLRMYGRGLITTTGWMMDNKAAGRGGSDTTTAGGSSSWSPPSCVSAQQLSGPR